MKNLSKIICSLVFLLAFLFPQIEQQIHAFEHIDDFHCNSSDKHFHEQEHRCSICDYTLTDSSEPTEAAFTTLRFSSSFHYSTSTFIVFCSNEEQNLPARAPPTV
jgi:hypothetical protein